MTQEDLNEVLGKSLANYQLRQLAEDGGNLESALTLIDRLESELLNVQEHAQNLEFLLNQKDEKISQLEAKAEAYDRLSTWHDDLPKNDGRYICVIGDGGYPVIFAKKFENGRWLLGEKEKIKWAYLPDGWEEI